ncbi:hypothetical protein DNTS_025855 [Danionella cerebrum]|uniref:Myosin motor domain-containing protein n=1 Tax=Danionella cerebrum TaxID=2873325 RepID=A0A553NA82_9TELE|nr:hypothetical protein DNTS_025855 [Danionella translucida]TRY62311.1 hypothetical protein DNTS_025855 [Danionella translucida]
MEYPVLAPAGLPPLGNPDILEGENDLTALTFLHEPAVLHNLRVRFVDYSSIYTYCGIVLVALNPYEQLPIYGEEVIDAYSGQDMADMEPHIYSVAEEAYRTMIREEKNQSIIISGESGSGKTVSAKFTMRYFAVVGGAAQQTSVEEKVLASNPIMEAIGNAKTTRNDNSSRFGKYIEIGFGRKGDIVGANVRTYLLEKSRVVFQASEERNYHIFYQLCASRDLPEFRTLRLDSPEAFLYTKQGQDVLIPGTDDIAELERTRQAFTVLGVQPDQQMEIFRILAAILHLGNVNIQASGRGGDRSYIDAQSSNSSFWQAGDHSLAVFAKLLRVEGAQMAQWLCHRRLAVGGEMLVKPMTGQQATEARDALAKHVYEQLFTWTVQRLNSSLRAHREKPKSFIGVLDIYGFETFDRNSFEQFCINYANEKLQQQFNRHVFQLEQEEYLREELPWSRIEFSDNQPCIALIEGQLGLLDLLDEECRMPKGSDDKWARKLYDQHLNKSPHFLKPRMSNSAFIVVHFADKVQYECDGFLDKNRDTVFEEPINILRASQSELVNELFQKESTGGCIVNPSLSNGMIQPGKRGHRDHKLTVGFQFRQSLHLLMDTLNSTTPHYVRCIKSNDLKRPFLWTYEEFFSRYRVLLRGSVYLNDIRRSCQSALPHLILDTEQYCFGKTKVFFRAGQVAVLEKLRGDRLNVSRVLIQSWVRGWLQRKHYKRLRWATYTLQRYTRGALARRLAWTLRYTHAALIIQKTYRMLAVRQLFITIRKATIKIQAFIRGTQARCIYRQMLMEKAAVFLQARVRGWLGRCSYKRIRCAVVLLQSCTRRRAARKELLCLRTEARSVEKYRELNKGMEVKLIQLQLKADQEARESAALKDTLRTEREAHRTELEQLQAELLKLQTRLKESAEAAPALAEKHAEEWRKVEEKSAREISQLTQEIQVLRAERDYLGKERDDLVGCLQEKENAQEELEEERRRYQSLLREFTRLEQRYDNLRDMSLFNRSEYSHGHIRKDSTVSLEPPSPVTSPFSSSPVFPSPEEVRRISVTSPTDWKPWSNGHPLNILMEDMSIVKDNGEKMKGEDLRFAYDAVRVANRFLETQLLSQRAEWKQESSAFRMKLQELQDRDSAGDLDINDVREQVLVREQESITEYQDPTSPVLQRSQMLSGLLECRKKDEGKLMKLLITDVKTEFILSWTPGLAARVLFLCLRQLDVSGDHTRVKGFVSSAVCAIKTALKKHSSDLDITAVWLKNSYLLRDLLLQHSNQQLQVKGSGDLVPLVTDVQECVRMLTDLCIQSYQQLLAITESRLQPVIVAAVLESESIPGLLGSSARRRRAGSEPRSPAAADGASMASVLRELSALQGAVSRQKIPPALQEQLLQRLLFLLCSTSLNSVLLRKDQCCWSRGLHIRYNVSVLEEWLRAHSLQTDTAVQALEPLIQAAQLLQMSKKTQADGEAMVQACSALSNQQIVKILSLYTPQSDVEERVTLNFIRIVQGLLKGRPEGSRQLLMDVRRVFPVSFPYEPPTLFTAAELQIPEALKISFLRRV